MDAKAVEHKPSARVLDVTRLSTRAGRILTGVDRVELAYLDAVSAQADVPCFAICKTALGYVLLDRQGMLAFATQIKSNNWQASDVLGRLNPRLNAATRIGQTAVRRLAIGRASRWGLGRLLGRLPDGFAYLNVGHSHLTTRIFEAVRAVRNTRIVVMIHDTIPLDFPQFQRPETTSLFRQKLQRVACFADVILCPSVAARSDILRHVKTMGRVPKVLPALLGVTAPSLGDVEIPDTPYFVTVGTIEPRKNHALLLDVWDNLPQPRPQLLICGQRGWLNDAVFDRLDNGSDGVQEVSSASDAHVAALVAGASGFLFPSFCEGFGLPPAEAALLQTPVICSDLPVCREVLKEHAIYLDPHDRYQWEKEIMQCASANRTTTQQDYDPPRWETHFKIVFTVT